MDNLTFSPQVPEMETGDGKFLSEVLQILNYISGAPTIDKEILATDVMGLGARYLKNLSEHKDRISSLEKELVAVRQQVKNGEVQASPDEEQLEDLDLSETNLNSSINQTVVCNSCSSDGDDFIEPLFASITGCNSNQASAQGVSSGEEETVKEETHLEDLDFSEPNVKSSSENTVECDNCISEEEEFIWPLLSSFPGWYKGKLLANEKSQPDETKEEEAAAQDVSPSEEKTSTNEEETKSVSCDCSSSPKENQQSNSNSNLKPGKKIVTRREEKKAKKQKKRRGTRW